ncbi:beta-1 3-galactosyl-O-glycosyl-glycoprotein beta-1 6-N-acetylglucosaminyltransferase [Biomphalaria glabrata]|nr:beta-1; 3-galactosyl-O-glycosyl-glycoprotein beta-1; 6-N-acetylglucosaminyltransferase-like [Biomphalaria glabrata]KAI8791876.1 beta-1,3-galactosyl-O-glycosyl-glycoprotein beta-1,6-N-acetylglucosaminyltransferase [Biomphalaria glabrata]
MKRFNRSYLKCLHWRGPQRCTILLLSGCFILILLSFFLLPSPDVSSEFGPRSQLVSNKFESLLLELIPPRLESRVDCSAIINGNMQEIDKAKQVSMHLKNTHEELTTESYLELTSNCLEFLEIRGYLKSSLSRDEFEFSIAYSILITEDVEMAERLLRAIYRPQNYYCIHVDSKSDAIYKVFLAIASCFNNIFIPERRLKMIWGTFSILEAELICMETLWPFARWKYFINLTGKEFPLKTNLDIVKVLQSLNGANDIHANIRETYTERWRYHFHYPPPWFRPVKGSVHIAASRSFVDFVLHNETAAKILSWVKTLPKFHDEVFFSTLNHNPHLMVPGSYTGDLDTDEITKPHVSRYKVWNTSSHYFCATNRWEKYICILTTGDLPLMLRSIHLFANKFYLQEDRIVVSCLEEWIYNATKDGFLETRQINISYYENLDIVKNQIRIPITS